MREHNFPTSPTGCVITPAGIIIGCAYKGPAKHRRYTHDAAVMQACMLPPPRQPGLRDQLVELIYTAPRPLLLSTIIAGCTLGAAKFLTR